MGNISSTRLALNSIPDAHTKIYESITGNGVSTNDGWWMMPEEDVTTLRSILTELGAYTDDGDVYTDESQESEPEYMIQNGLVCADRAVRFILEG